MASTEFNHNSYLKHTPFPLRLGALKDKMQQQAFHRPEELGNTIHAVGVAIIRNYYKKMEVVRDAQLQKLIEMVQIKRHNIKHHVHVRKYGSHCNGVHQLKLYAD